MTKSSTETRTSNSSRTLRLARKELREILRDRRTVLTLVLMPLLVYPLLGVIMRNGVMSNASLMQKLTVFVGFETEEQQLEFARSMYIGRQLLAGESPAEKPNPEDYERAMTFEGQKQNGEFVLVLLEDKTSKEALEAGELDLAIQLESVSETRSGGFLKWNLQRRSNAVLADQGERIIQNRFDAINDRYINNVFDRVGLSKDLPATLTTSIVKSGQGISPLVTFIPLMLVLMTMTGAVYPAIDLTAGERERGTMEILVAAPVSRMTLLSGKFFAVLTVALLTATMNLISMFVTLFALGLSGTILGSVGPTMIIQVVVLMVVFAAFFSAVLLSITSIARSFKEAQAYLIPLMLVSLTPGVFSLMPDLEINSLLAVTPLVNTVLMGRDLLQGNVNLLMFAIVLISTVFYGMLALGLAARIFGSDAVMSGSGSSWQQLFRRRSTPISYVEIPLAFQCLAVVFPLFLIAGALPSQLFQDIGAILLANSVVSCLIFVAVPVGVLRFSRVSLGPALQLRKPGILAWPVAIIAGCCLWPFIYELEISMISADRVAFLQEKMAASMEKLNVQPLWLKLLALAITPAVCEEFFFRGVLQNSIRQRFSAWKAVVLSAVIFGLFHVIFKDVLFYERLIPSTLMGIALGCLFERTGSVYPGMLLHVCHNGLLTTMSHYQTSLEKWDIFMEERTHLPSEFLIFAGIGVVVAFGLLWWRFRGQTSPQTASTVNG